MIRYLSENIKNKWNSIPITVKASTAYAVSSILQRCLSLITLPLFTRLLTTEQYGQLTIYQSWLGIFSIVLTLNLAYGSFSTAMVKFQRDRDGYISSVEGICLILTVIFLIVYLPFRELWNKLFELPTGIICIMVAELLGTTAIQLWSGKKRFEFKYKSIIAITLGISFASPVIAYLMIISRNEKGYARIIGYAIVNIIVGGTFYLVNVMHGKKIFCKEYWKYALSFNVPLLVYYLSQVVFNQSDRIMISHMVGKDKAAIYGVGYSLAMILVFLLNAINNSYVPWYYEKIKEGRQEENRRVSLMIAVIMAVSLTIVIWFAPEIISVLAGDQYAEAIYVVPPITISLLLLFYAQLFINVEFYYEEKNKLVLASVGAAILNMMLNLFFIRHFGFVAAAYTTLFSYIVFTYSNYREMKRVLIKKKIDDTAYEYKGLILILLIVCIAATIGQLLYRLFLFRLCAFILLVLICYINKRKVMALYKTIKNNTR